MYNWRVCRRRKPLRMADAKIGFGSASKHEVMRLWQSERRTKKVYREQTRGLDQTGAVFALGQWYPLVGR